MIRKILAICLALVMMACFTACGEGEETTLTGMVVSVNGTVLSIVEMDSSMGGRDFAEGERPTMPADMEGFNPENFGGTLPKGETFPQRGENGKFELPEGSTMPQNGERPEMPEGMTMPQNGKRPSFDGENGGKMPGFGNFNSDAETKEVDIKDAHISLEIDGGKASGSLEDVKQGSFVTITINGKGEAINVLVSSRSGFGGMRQEKAS